MWTVQSWIDAAQFTLEAQTVVAMRLMKIAAGGQNGILEYTRMVLEKFDAVAAANTAGAQALSEGSSVEIAPKRALASVRQRVHENHLRLVRE